jgi:hypothetical protein
MFPFFSKDSGVLVQPLYRNGNSLAFACDCLLEGEQGLSVRDRGGHQAEVQVQQRRRADDRSWIYFAELLQGELEPEWPTPGYQWRITPRFPIGVRVRSPQLPEFSALTEDLSPDGAQLQLAGPLNVGDEIELFLDLDSGFPSVHCVGRVCWTRLTQPCRAGIAFLGMEGDGQAQLRSYLAERSEESVLPGLVAETVEQPELEASVLEKLAFLQSSFNEGETLVLSLLTNDEVMEVRFPLAEVMSTNVTSRLVSRIITQETPEKRTRTWLLDPDGNPLAEIDSLSPEIMCRGVRVHDLD